MGNIGVNKDVFRLKSCEDAVDVLELYLQKTSTHISIEEYDRLICNMIKNYNEITLKEIQKMFKNNKGGL